MDKPVALVESPVMAQTHPFLNFNTAMPQEYWEEREYDRHEADRQLPKREIIQGLLDRLPEMLHVFYPNGRRDGNTYLLGNIKGEAGQSLKIALEGSEKGCWYDFDCPSHNGGVLDLFAARYGWDTKNKSDFPKILRSAQEWLGVTPRSLPKFPGQTQNQKQDQTPNKDWGVFIKSWFYRDSDGTPSVRVCRYEKDGKKSFRPFDLKANKYGCPSPRPLYNLPGIAQADVVVFVEGEKCADALISIGICATTAMSGASAPPDKTDWSPLNGKHVLVWPDHDTVGKEHADRVIHKLKSLGLPSLALMVIPEDKPEKWDAADAVAEGINMPEFIDICSQRVVSPPNTNLPAFTAGQLLDDVNPLPEDLIAPRILTPGGLLVFGGAPKVGKTDLMLSWLAHLAAGLPFLGMVPPKPLKIFYLQTEIMYDYLRERLKTLVFDPLFLPFVRENLVLTPQMRLLLDEEGVTQVYNAITRFFDPKNVTVDLIVIDPLRNVYDPGKSGSENDNTAMLAFLQDRVEKLRSLVNPAAGIILTHHTKKITKKMVEEDPFQALSGAASLRSFYTTGLLLFRPDEQKSIRQIMFELRNGKSILPKWVDKVDGRWEEMMFHSERTVRKDYGQKLDAERQRCHDVILQLLLDEARKGNLYTPTQFREVFENTGGLGGHTTIDARVNVLATKGFIKFNKDPAIMAGSKSKYGVMCVEGMEIPVGEKTDPETGEITCSMKRLLPTHFKESQRGAILPVENPEVWVYLDDVL